MNRTRLKVLLVKHEGDRRRPYLDCCGKWWRECACATKGNLTLGVGRNLDAKPMPDCEVALMLDNDIVEARATCLQLFPGFDTLDETRQHALLDMAFNLGHTRLAKFSQMIAAVGARDWDRAANAAADSAWFMQVGSKPGQRGHTVVQMLRTGT